jgi:hypothetical protein
VKDRRILLWVGAALAGILFITAAIVLVRNVTGPKNALIGRWRLRDSTTFCNVAYPGRVEFFPDEQYVASGLTLLWNGGRYAVVDHGRVRMETRSGVALYDVHLHGRFLAFTNSSGCTIDYERVTE